MNKYPEPTVGAVIFNPEGKILLCKSQKWNNKYVLPGGHIELGEKMEDALRREILEETGLNVYDIELIGLEECIYNNSFHEKKHFIFIDYQCKTDSYDVILNEESQEYRWVALDEIESYNLNSFTKKLLMQLKSKKESKNKVEILYKY